MRYRQHARKYKYSLYDPNENVIYFRDDTSQVSRSLDKIDNFLKTCRIMHEKDLYVQLIRGVDGLYDYLCNNTVNKEGKLYKTHGTVP